MPHTVRTTARGSITICYYGRKSKATIGSRVDCTLTFVSSYAEIAVGIICACMPALPSFCRHIRDLLGKKTPAIEIQVGKKRRDRKRLEHKSATQGKKSRVSNEDEEDEGFRLECRDCDDSFCILTAIPPISIALLFVNHQVSEEALQVLYCRNRFTFDVSPREVFNFFKYSHPFATRFITNIGFAIGSTLADDYQLREDWKPYAVPSAAICT